MNAGNASTVLKINTGLYTQDQKIGSPEKHPAPSPNLHPFFMTWQKHLTLSYSYPIKITAFIPNIKFDQFIFHYNIKNLYFYKN